MIQKININNFKSIKETSIRFDRLNMLIGANASGKSNLVEVISFLKFLSSGKKLSELSELSDPGFMEKIGIRGKSMEMIRGLEKSIDINIDFNSYNNSNENKYFLSIGKKGKNELMITSEHLSIGVNKNPQFGYYKMQASLSNPDSSDIDFKYLSKEDGNVSADIVGKTNTPFFLQLSQGIFPNDSKGLWSSLLIITDDLQKLLSKILVVNPVPSLMRDYSIIGSKTLNSNCQNVSAVLYDLLTEAAEKVQNKIDVLSFIKSLPEQDIIDIDFIKTPRDEVMLKIKEKAGPKVSKFDITQLSDGTLRMICFVTALLSVPEESLVVIEELDNGIHPSRASYLLKEIDRISKVRKLTILMSSHNPAIIDAMPEGKDSNIAFCYRDIKDGSTKIVSLDELENYPEIMLRDSIGNLLSQGELDKMVKRPVTKEQRVADGLKWLKSIQ